MHRASSKATRMVKLKDLHKKIRYECFVCELASVSETAAAAAAQRGDS